MTRRPRPPSRLLARWPPAGCAIGIALSLSGAVVNSNRLIEAGTNLVTVSGLFLVQQKRNRKRDEDQE